MYIDDIDRWSGQATLNRSHQNSTRKRDVQPDFSARLNERSVMSFGWYMDVAQINENQIGKLRVSSAGFAKPAVVWNLMDSLFFSGAVADWIKQQNRLSSLAPSHPVVSVCNKMFPENTAIFGRCQTSKCRVAMPMLCSCYHTYMFFALVKLQAPKGNLA